MATATAISATDLHADSLPLIDLRLLSQSELLSLSLSSSSSSLSLLQNDADLSTPKIDRSVFNESAGSRKQTFSRLRLAPPRNNYSEFASSSTSPIQIQNLNNTTDQDSSQIVSLLKTLFGSESEEIDENYDNALVTVPLQYNDYLDLKKPEDVTVHMESTPRRRKRGRPRKNESNVGMKSENYAVVEVKEVKKEGEMLMAGENGGESNYARLGNWEDPYGEELKRRTGNLRTEGELVGLLEGVEGEWVSSRKKSRVVNAAEFGGMLPTGWKLVVSVKRRAGCAWLACKRYIRFLAILLLCRNCCSFGTLGYID